MNNKKKTLLYGIVLSALAAGLSSCGWFSKKQAPEQAPPVMPVVKVSRGDLSSYADFATEIESRNVAEIRSQATGYVDRVAVQEGSRVKKGETILKINDQEYRQRAEAAQAAVEAANASLNNARLEVDKTAPLVEKNIISKFQLETAQSNLKSAEAALSQARSQLNNARIQLSYTDIVSPVNGVIGKIDIYPGSLLSAGGLVTTVAADGDVFAYFAFDEKKLLEMLRDYPGKTLYDKVAALPEVELVLADGSVYPYKGKVEVASGLVNNKTGSIQLKAVFPNPDMTLHSGSTGKVRLPVHYTDVLLVPQKATFELQNKTLVYVVDSTGNVRSQNITVEGASEGYYAVSDGLKEGDTVVFEGISKLRDGMPVTPKDTVLAAR